MSRFSCARALAAVCAAATFSLAAADHASAASGLTNRGDFAQIARNGFALTVDGAFFADATKTLYPNLQPNLGSTQNSYSWSMAWFQGALWVGTNRDIREPDIGLRGAAEIWRYQPSAYDEGGDWGLSGTWSRVFQSPKVNRKLALASRGGLSANTARDLGYRNMAVCNAGDGTERLYATAAGIPGNILYHDGQTFQLTSEQGLSNNLGDNPYDYLGQDLSALPVDLGYRGLACFKGRLWTSPAGSVQDVDAALHPVVHMNPNPANGAAWQTAIDVSDPASTPLADPGNIGIFQIEALGQYLWVATLNRATGMELWRGDGSDCLEPWVGDGHCNITWVKVIDNGAGRPPDRIGPPVDNAGATLGIFGNDLYIGVTESGVTSITLAEMFRIRDAGTVPAGGPSAPHQWQLIAGWPRRDYQDPSRRQPGLENLGCSNVGDFANSLSELPTEVRLLWEAAAGSELLPLLNVTGLPLVELDDDADADDCLPASNAGPGLPTGALQHPLGAGDASYFWRFAEHQGELFVTTLDAAGVVDGFDLFKTANGIDFHPLFADGLGNFLNYGGRSLESTPIGLALGTANPFTDNPDGGTEVFIGTTAPRSLGAPRADAGPDAVAFDTAHTGTVQYKLQGGGADSFGGQLAPSPYEWFAGAVADQCATLAAADAISTDAEHQVDLASEAGAQEMLSHTFTLRVTDESGRVGCDEVTVTASQDLPPAIALHTGVPASNGSPPVVRLVDFDADGRETYEVSADCIDDHAALTRCELGVLDVPGASLSNRLDSTTDPSLCTGKTQCRVSARVSVPSWRALPDGAGQPRLQVLAEDANGYRSTTQWASLTQTIENSWLVNDSPVCRNADLFMLLGVDTQLVVDPAAIDPPICVDPDGDPMSYQGRTPGPGAGTATFGPLVRYQPNDPGSPLLDQFELLALDAAGLRSDRDFPGNLAIRVTLGEDHEAPVAAIAFPANGQGYSPDGYAAGCATPGPDVCGTAADAPSGIAAVQVALRRESDGRFWNSSLGDFVDTGSPDSPFWNTPIGTTAWRLAFDPPVDGHYRVLAKAMDRAGNESPVAIAGFSRFLDATPPSVSIGFPVGGTSYTQQSFAAGCGTGGADLCGNAADADTGVQAVEVGIQRSSDGAWWNGSAFVSASPLWLTAAGTGPWSYAGFAPASQGSYLVRARARDNAGNLSSVAQTSFSYSTRRIRRPGR